MLDSNGPFSFKVFKKNYLMDNERLIRTSHMPWSQLFKGYIGVLDSNGPFFVQVY